MDINSSKEDNYLLATLPGDFHSEISRLVTISEASIFKKI